MHVSWLMMKSTDGTKLGGVVNNDEDRRLYRAIWISWEAEPITTRCILPQPKAQFSV